MAEPEKSMDDSSIPATAAAVVESIDIPQPSAEPSSSDPIITLPVEPSSNPDVVNDDTTINSTTDNPLLLPPPSSPPSNPPLDIAIDVENKNQSEDNSTNDPSVPPTSVTEETPSDSNQVTSSDNNQITIEHPVAEISATKEERMEHSMDSSLSVPAPASDHHHQQIQEQNDEKKEVTSHELPSSTTHDDEMQIENTTTVVETSPLIETNTDNSINNQIPSSIEGDNHQDAAMMETEEDNRHTAEVAIEGLPLPIIEKEEKIITDVHHPSSTSPATAPLPSPPPTSPPIHPLTEAHTHHPNETEGDDAMETITEEPFNESNIPPLIKSEPTPSPTSSPLLTAKRELAVNNNNNNNNAVKKSEKDSKKSSANSEGKLPSTNAAPKPKGSGQSNNAKASKEKDGNHKSDKKKADKSKAAANQSAPKAVSTAVEPPPVVEGDSETRCICGRNDDATGAMICCDKCLCWQHLQCVGMTEREANNTDKYYCEQCDPDYYVHIRRAENIAKGLPIVPVVAPPPASKAKPKASNKEKKEKSTKDNKTNAPKIPHSPALTSASAKHPQPKKEKRNDDVEEEINAMDIANKRQRRPSEQWSGGGHEQNFPPSSSTTTTTTTDDHSINPAEFSHSPHSSPLSSYSHLSREEKKIKKQIERIQQMEANQHPSSSDHHERNNDDTIDHSSFHHHHHQNNNNNNQEYGNYHQNNNRPQYHEEIIDHYSHHDYPPATDYDATEGGGDDRGGVVEEENHRQKHRNKHHRRIDEELPITIENAPLPPQSVLETLYQSLSHGTLMPSSLRGGLRLPIINAPIYEGRKRWLLSDYFDKKLNEKIGWYSIINQPLPFHKRVLLNYHQNKTKSTKSNGENKHNIETNHSNNNNGVSISMITEKVESLISEDMANRKRKRDDGSSIGDEWCSSSERSSMELMIKNEISMNS